MNSRFYNENPTIEFFDVALISGWDEILSGGEKFSIDGPIDLPWDHIIELLNAKGLTDIYDTRAHQPSEEDIHGELTQGLLEGQEFFGRIPSRSFAELISKAISQNICLGPGSGSLEDRLTMYLDRSKRVSEAKAIESGRKLQRLYFYDWPLSDRQRDLVMKKNFQYVDISNFDEPVGIDSRDLSRVITTISRDTFRTVPYFNDALWGGNWAQNVLGMNVDRVRSALGYEFIAPESAVRITNGDAEMEIPVSVLLSIDADGFVGESVAQVFKGEFPIRFDYLDTFNGENLSIHVHPGEDDMREIFGTLLGQEESYYVMVASTDSVIYLGLDGQYRGTDSIVAHPAKVGDLYLIPHGTPHGSGKGNVVLEVSTTPYLYSLRLHDWERLNSTGFPRPLNQDLAISAMKSSDHRGQMSADFVPLPQTVETGEGFLLEKLGSLKNWYYEVLRLNISPGARYTMELKDSFLLTTVVSGEYVQAGSKEYSYAETFVVPARRKSIEFLNSSPTQVSLLIGRMKEGWAR